MFYGILLQKDVLLHFAQVNNARASSNTGCECGCTSWRWSKFIVCLLIRIQKYFSQQILVYFFLIDFSLA